MNQKGAVQLTGEGVKVNQEITDLITEYVRNYHDLKGTEFDWRYPVIGFADAQDLLFPKLKELIGPKHALPSDLVPDARSVIAFFLPLSKEVVKSNTHGEESSREWDISSIETNNLIDDLNKYLFEKLSQKGYVSSLLPATYNYDGEKLISDWSHRHVAYIAGIGKFGIHNMFITRSGCCGRLGSVVTNLALLPTPRTEDEYCLYKYNGTCKKCVERCVNNAFQIGTDQLFCDRTRCNQQIYDKLVPVYPIGIGDTCGKCMCGVPCSLVSPTEKLIRPADNPPENRPGGHRQFLIPRF
ncbi:epoxyqueuosine reductase [Desulfosporosinus sp.]|uniref:epoxyqueuosine reductase n=1 Tax=Desulfosporosinus sp. TaxID=157907 RepID=UPI0025BE1B59|nr:epoxyqueuosine reductase [Desulfosporosinus sp.]MBC2723477.1 epoxyqueuosine reductase [Desulfosporosinus sp.]MBC2725692.1 epoxyqueuosine reductase [Desulfosporosinus sp.]